MPSAVYICNSKLATIGSDNDLSPGRRQAIIWTIAGILLPGPLGMNFNEIFIEIYIFSFSRKSKNSSRNWRSFCRDLSMLPSVLIFPIAHPNSDILLYLQTRTNAAHRHVQPGDTWVQSEWNSLEWWKSTRRYFGHQCQESPRFRDIRLWWTRLV